jgi:hypothetical protein
MANYHVTNPKGSEMWRVVRAGAKRAAATADTQAQAEKVAKKLTATSGGGEVMLHKPNGGPIRDSDTIAPGNDPYPPRDSRH